MASGEGLSGDELGVALEVFTGADDATDEGLALGAALGIADATLDGSDSTTADGTDTGASCGMEGVSALLFAGATAWRAGAGAGTCAGTGAGAT